MGVWLVCVEGGGMDEWGRIEWRVWKLKCEDREGRE